MASDTARKQEIIKVTEQLIEAINNGDFEAYTGYCWSNGANPLLPAGSLQEAVREKQGASLGPSQRSPGDVHRRSRPLFYPVFGCWVLLPWDVSASPPSVSDLFSILSLVAGSFSPGMCRHRRPQSATSFLSCLWLLGPSPLGCVGIAALSQRPLFYPVFGCWVLLPWDVSASPPSVSDLFSILSLVAGSFSPGMCRHRRPQSATSFLSCLWLLGPSPLGCVGIAALSQRPLFYPVFGCWVLLPWDVSASPPSVSDLFSILSLVAGSFSPGMCRHRRPQSATSFLSCLWLLGPSPLGCVGIAALSQRPLFYPVFGCWVLLPWDVSASPPSVSDLFSILSLVAGSFSPGMCRHRRPQSATSFLSCLWLLGPSPLGCVGIAALSQRPLFYPVFGCWVLLPWDVSASPPSVSDLFSILSLVAGSFSPGMCRHRRPQSATSFLSCLWLLGPSPLGCVGIAALSQRPLFYPVFGCWVLLPWDVSASPPSVSDLFSILSLVAGSFSPGMCRHRRPQSATSFLSCLWLLGPSPLGCVGIAALSQRPLFYPVFGCWVLLPWDVSASPPSVSDLFSILSLVAGSFSPGMCRHRRPQSATSFLSCLWLLGPSPLGCVGIAALSQRPLFYPVFGCWVLLPWDVSASPPSVSDLFSILSLVAGSFSPGMCRHRRPQSATSFLSCLWLLGPSPLGCVGIAALSQRPLFYPVFGCWVLLPWDVSASPPSVSDLFSILSLVAGSFSPGMCRHRRPQSATSFLSCLWLLGPSPLGCVGIAALSQRPLFYPVFGCWVLLPWDVSASPPSVSDLFSILSLVAGSFSPGMCRHRRPQSATSFLSCLWLLGPSPLGCVGIAALSQRPLFYPVFGCWVLLPWDVSASPPSVSDLFSILSLVAGSFSPGMCRHRRPQSATSFLSCLWLLGPSPLGCVGIAALSQRPLFYPVFGCWVLLPWDVSASPPSVSDLFSILSLVAGSFSPGMCRHRRPQSATSFLSCLWLLGPSPLGCVGIAALSQRPLFYPVFGCWVLLPWDVSASPPSVSDLFSILSLVAGSFSPGMCRHRRPQSATSFLSCLWLLGPSPLGCVGIAALSQRPLFYPVFGCWVLLPWDVSASPPSVSDLFSILSLVAGSFSPGMCRHRRPQSATSFLSCLWLLGPSPLGCVGIAALSQRPLFYPVFGCWVLLPWDVSASPPSVSDLFSILSLVAGSFSPGMCRHRRPQSATSFLSCLWLLGPSPLGCVGIAALSQRPLFYPVFGCWVLLPWDVSASPPSVSDLFSILSLVAGSFSPGMCRHRRPQSATSFLSCLWLLGPSPLGCVGIAALSQRPLFYPVFGCWVLLPWDVSASPPSVSDLFSILSLVAGSFSPGMCRHRRPQSATSFLSCLWLLGPSPLGCVGIAALSQRPLFYPVFGCWVLLPWDVSASPPSVSDLFSILSLVAGSFSPGMCRHRRPQSATSFLSCLWLLGPSPLGCVGIAALSQRPLFYPVFGCWVLLPWDVSASPPSVSDLFSILSLVAGSFSPGMCRHRRPQSATSFLSCLWLLGPSPLGCVGIAALSQRPLFYPVFGCWVLLPWDVSASPPSVSDLFSILSLVAGSFSPGMCRHRRPQSATSFLSCLWLLGPSPLGCVGIAALSQRPLFYPVFGCWVLLPWDVSASPPSVSDLFSILSLVAGSFSPGMCRHRRPQSATSFLSCLWLLGPSPLGCVGIAALSQRPLFYPVFGCWVLLPWDVSASPPSVSDLFSILSLVAGSFSPGMCRHRRPQSATSFLSCLWLLGPSPLGCVGIAALSQRPLFYPVFGCWVLLPWDVSASPPSVSDLFSILSLVAGSFSPGMCRHRRPQSATSFLSCLWLLGPSPLGCVGITALNQ
ncbi:UNVERIFIED_CONTAM: hypothetical protein FKN15_012906 [Acipenser sinensis]